MTEDPKQTKRTAVPVAWRIPAILVGTVVVVAVAGTLLHWHARSIQSHTALSQSPKNVTVVRAHVAIYQPQHRYVGTMRPWIEARVGPQFVSAYVSDVLVRPGDVVNKGAVLATLDCRNASERSKSLEMQARALQSEQSALSAQAERVTRLLDGGFVAINDVEQETARSAAQMSQLEAQRASVAAARLSVDDCVLRAPFDGDVGERMADPGAFVRPGDELVSVVDRGVVRFVVDVPESDFASVAPGTPVDLKLLAVDQELHAAISRRSPAADPSTRTIRVEVDIPDPERRIPVNTTAEVRVPVGAPVSATSFPVTAADVGESKARLFAVADEVAHARTVPFLGEIAGELFVDPTYVLEGDLIVLEGRSGLHDKDRVNARELDAGAATPPTVVGTARMTDSGGAHHD
jgi:RND family efflux transporter MFP subunit